MFSGDKKQGGKGGRIDTLIGRGTRISGDLRFSGGLHVDGEIHGNVSSDGSSDSMLSLSQHGVIKGEVHVSHLTLNGTVEGDVHADQGLELGPQARITGDVYYNLVEIAVGATVNGKLVHKPLGPTAPAPRAKGGEAPEGGKRG